jgi:hypothetical protein
MSRSYKKNPFTAICGGDSAKYDKQLAHRGVRRAQNQATRRMAYDEDLLMPHRYECTWNETYNWGRDGKQCWQAPDARDWERHVWAVRGWYLFKFQLREPYCSQYLPWPPTEFVKMMRK